MTARDLLAKVVDALKARGHEAEIDYPYLMNGDVTVAWVTPGNNVMVLAALVFDGHEHIVPEGCDTITVTPGTRHATVERIVAAIEKRMAARAKSLPVPVDATAQTREP